MSKQLTIEQVEQICKVSADGIKQILATVAETTGLDVQVDFRKEHYTGGMLGAYIVRVSTSIGDAA